MEGTGVAQGTSRRAAVTCVLAPRTLEAAAGPSLQELQGTVC